MSAAKKPSVAKPDITVEQIITVRMGGVNSELTHTEAVALRDALDAVLKDKSDNYWLEAQRVMERSRQANPAPVQPWRAPQPYMLDNTPAMYEGPVCTPCVTSGYAQRAGETPSHKRGTTVVASGSAHTGEYTFTTSH